MSVRDVVRDMLLDLENEPDSEVLAGIAAWAALQPQRVEALRDALDHADGTQHLTLRPVDLSKAHRHEHEDIDLATPYLVRHHGQPYVGSFGRQWYGLNFYTRALGSIQFDAPGSNSSRWEGVWAWDPNQLVKGKP